ALCEQRPAWVVVTGDRYESFGAAVAATMLGIPLAHVAGGETDVATNQDGNLRNAMTKLAQLHFVANDVAADRVRALGEEPWRVRVVGLPSLDNLLATPAERSLLEANSLAPPGMPFVLVSFLPVTLHPVQSQQHLRILLEALSSIGGAHKLCVLSNADSGGDEHDALIRRWAAGRPDVSLSAALSAEQYTAALRHCACYVGNSSSGVIETPVFGTPSVIVGIRQSGRARAANIVDEMEPTVASLSLAIQRQIEHGPFANVRSPFGDGHAAQRICHSLAECADAEDLMSKHLVAAETIA
ncbi:MAG: UDP-N-acetylglucosamine 2-epimerase, partial [Phycisphaerae bacterium]|nr:UDP-N-acetylglucosamine 2-epimerase [Phycisphaerae bacterium]